MTCISETLCLDQPARVAEALELYRQASQFVNTSVGVIENNPRVVFCSTDSCAQSFDLGWRAGMTIGRLGIVIGARGWKSFCLRHEMIHHLQNEKLGALTAWTKPAWFREGMAYALSQDPRLQLAEPLEGYRVRFQQWYAEVGEDRLWSAAAGL